MLVYPVTLVVIEAPGVGDVDRLEQGFQTSHRLLVVVVFAMVFSSAKPWLVEVEDLRCERRALGIPAQGVVDADEKLLQRQRDWTAFGVVTGQKSCLFVENLSRKHALLEGDDFGHLFGCRRCGCLGVAKRGIDGLI